MADIKTIEIKNFKSIRHQKIEYCRRVNVFIGYPNVGKSNILEALGLFSIRECKLQNFTVGDICRVKNFNELYFNRDTRDAARIILNESIEAEVIINESNELDIRINQLGFSSEKRPRETIFSVTIENRPGNVGFRIGVSGDKSNNGIESIKKYEFKSDTRIDSTRPKALAIPNGNNLLDLLQANGELRKEVVDIFNDYALKLVLEREDQASIKVQKELADGSAVSIGYHQIADTIRRLIFYKAAIITNSDSVILFEEPEAHMFPPYIRKLTADIMFDNNNNQYFIATHSPFVINELIEEIRDDLSIYVVDYDKGETIIKRLTDDEVLEVSQFGIDLFFNLESYLDKYAKSHSA